MKDQIQEILRPLIPSQTEEDVYKIDAASAAICELICLKLGQAYYWSFFYQEELINDSLGKMCACLLDDGFPRPIIKKTLDKIKTI